MTMSPSSILAKLDELKKWQDKQQERMMQQHHKQLDPNTHSQIHFAKVEAPIKNITNIEHRELNNDAKPKRPYLRRGTGLGRFRMGPGEQFKPFANSKLTPKKITYDSTTKHLTPLKKPDLKVIPKAVWETPPPPPVNDTDRELLNFEALEQRIMQNSFCSTNSSIVRLLSSTPHKSSPKKEQNSQVQAIYAQRTTEGNDIMQVYTQYNHNVTNNMIDADEACELQEINDCNKDMENNYLNLVLQVKRFINMDVTTCSSPSCTTDDVDSTLHIDTYNDKNKWTDLEMATSETASSSSSLSGISEHKSTTRTVETMTDLPLPDVEMQDKLDAEIKSVRSESAKVKKLKEQMEQQIKEFQRHKKEIYKQVEEEKARVNVTLEEERKKLTKEKMVFERYVKDLQNKPSKKEREEIATLKTEIATLKETLKLKETKHGTTQARLRNQIKSLDTENTNLKNEIDNLNQQHAKLLVNQKLNRKPSNTKMLHEINKSLSKLTSEQGKKKESSYEELKENNKNASNSTTVSSDDILQEKHERDVRILSDGSTHIKYINGNVKTISSDGNIIKFQYFNGDIKTTNLLEGTVHYYYHQDKIDHTTNADGTELIEFPDGQIERRLTGGLREIDYPNGAKHKIHTNGTEEAFLPDGTIVNTNKDGRVITLPNGQKEIHTSEHKRREYPDGTVKILYPDGVQETRYANGRIRLKDKYGKLIMDSQN